MDQKPTEPNTQESQSLQPSMGGVSTTSPTQGEVSSTTALQGAATSPIPSPSQEGTPPPVSGASPAQASSSSVASGIPTPGSAGLPPKSPSHVGVIIAIILLVVAVLGGAFGLAMMQNKPQSNLTPTPIAQPTVAEPTPTSLPTPSTDEVNSGTGNSNEQLQKDTKTLDAKITGVAEDTQAADEGLNDQQTDLNQ